MVGVRGRVERGVPSTQYPVPSTQSGVRRVLFLSPGKGQFLVPKLLFGNGLAAKLRFAPPSRQRLKRSFGRERSQTGVWEREEGTSRNRLIGVLRTPYWVLRPPLTSSRHRHRMSNTISEQVS